MTALSCILGVTVRGLKGVTRIYSTNKGDVSVSLVMDSGEGYWALSEETILRLRSASCCHIMHVKAFSFGFQ